jgi:hypothetical protein
MTAFGERFTNPPKFLTVGGGSTALLAHTDPTNTPVPQRIRQADRNGWELVPVLFSAATGATLVKKPPVISPGFGRGPPNFSGDLLELPVELTHRDTQDKHSQYPVFDGATKPAAPPHCIQGAKV